MSQYISFTNIFQHTPLIAILDSIMCYNHTHSVHLSMLLIHHLHYRAATCCSLLLVHPLDVPYFGEDTCRHITTVVTHSLTILHTLQYTLVCHVNLIVGTPSIRALLALYTYCGSYTRSILILLCLTLASFNLALLSVRGRTRRTVCFVISISL